MATSCSCSCSISSKIRRRRSRSIRPSLKTKKINNSCCLFLKLLPVEIASDIFSRLPVDSVLQCKLVCKTWRDLLIANHHHSNNNNNSIVEKAAGGFLLRIHYKEPGFYYGEYNNDDKVPCFNLTRKPIFNHQYPFQDVKKWYIVGSCNGLICLRRQKWPGICTSQYCEHGTDHYHHDMYVCNPYTGEYAKLPNPNHPKLDHPRPRYCSVVGFGYHPFTKEYKVIRIYYHYDSINSSSPSVLMLVYTLGSSSSSSTTAWRSIGEIEHKVYRSGTWGRESDNNSWGILLNGVLYWLTENRRLIISFDLEDEKFRDISTTPEFHGPSVLGVLNGCLCFSTGMDDSTRIWVMNNDDYSWIRKFSISWKYQRGFSPYYPLACLESGKILLHCNFEIFVSYDPETEHIVELKKMVGSFDIIPYMKSSVSLKALGEKEAIHVKAQEENKKKNKRIEEADHYSGRKTRRRKRSVVSETSLWLC